MGKMQHNNKNNRNNSGFTLIEILISIFILTIAITAVLYIFPFGSQVQKSSQMATVAVQLAQGKIEEVNSKSYEEILIETSIEDYDFDPNFPFYKRTTEINYFNPENPEENPGVDLGIKKIEVTVFWRSLFGIGEREVKLATLIAKR